MVGKLRDRINRVNKVVEMMTGKNPQDETTLITEDTSLVDKINSAFDADGKLRISSK